MLKHRKATYLMGNPYWTEIKKEEKTLFKRCNNAFSFHYTTRIKGQNTCTFSIYVKVHNFVKIRMFSIY